MEGTENFVSVHWGDNPTDAKTAVRQTIHVKDVAPTFDAYVEELKKGNDKHIRMRLSPKFMRESTDLSGNAKLDTATSQAPDDAKQKEEELIRRQYRKYPCGA